MSEDNTEETSTEVVANNNNVLNERFINDLLVHFRSAVPCLVCDVHDRRQFVRDVKTAASRVDAKVVYWDADEGLHFFPNNSVSAKSLGSGEATQHPVEALRCIQEMIMEQKLPQDGQDLGRKVMFLMRNFQDCWTGMAWGPGRPYKVQEQINNLIPFFENRGCSFIFYGPNIKTPDALIDEVQRLEYTFPGKEELRSRFNLIHSSIKKNRPNVADPSDEVVEKAIESTQGLYANKAAQAFTLSIVKNDFNYSSDKYIADVSAERRKYIKESGLVQLQTPRGGYEMIGGLEDAKEMVRRDLMGLKPEAREFGLDKPNGILLGGPPGTGNSAFANAVAGEFGLDLICVQADKIKSKYVGESEKNLAKVLALPELYQGAGCILYFEECDKFFGSMSSRNDDSQGGTGMTLFGALLAYFQDRQYNANDCAYVMGTFNDGRLLDPAILRPGRFDSKAWIGTPNEQGRADIFAIHLQKRNRNPEDFPIDELVELTNNFTGCEIENVVKDMLKRAWCDKISNESKLLIKCAEAVKPQASIKDGDFDKQNKWAEESGFLSACESPAISTEERSIIDMPAMVKVDEKKLKKKKIKND